MDVHIAAGPLQNAPYVCPVEGCAKGLFMSIVYRVTRLGLAPLATVYLCEIHADVTYRIQMGTLPGVQNAPIAIGIIPPTAFEEQRGVTDS